MTLVKNIGQVYLSDIEIVSGVSDIDIFVVKIKFKFHFEELSDVCIFNNHM